MPRSRRLAVVALGVGGAGALALFACRDDATSAPLCRGSIQAESGAADAGTAVTLTVNVANLDDDVAATVTVSWSVSGGGAMDHPVSHVVLTPRNDPYGNPAGISGSESNKFLTRGPTGSYTVRAAVDTFGRCAPTSYEVTVQVNGSVPDGGVATDGGDAGDAADEATTTDAADASDATDAAVDAADR